MNFSKYPVLRKLRKPALLIDFTKFFDNIRHDILFARMERHISDPRIIELTRRFVSVFGPGVSLGLGSQVSQNAAVFYSNTLDHLIKEKLRIKYYGRYMDDLYLIHAGRDYLRRCLVEIETACVALGISINRKKTRIVKLSSGVDFLKGKYRLLPSGKILRLPGKESAKCLSIRITRRYLMVYLWKRNGAVCHHTDLEAAVRIDGLTAAPDITVGEADFEAAGGIARIEGGGIALCRTEAEKQAEENGRQIAVLKQLLWGQTAACRPDSGHDPETQDLLRALRGVIYENPEMFDRVKRAWAVWMPANGSYGCMLNGGCGCDRTGGTGKKLANKRADFKSSFRNAALAEFTKRNDRHTVEVRLSSSITHGRGRAPRDKAEVLTANYPIETPETHGGALP